MFQTLDLHFLGHEDTIAAFLLQTDEGNILFESGPHSTLPVLEKALAQHDLQLTDIQHLMLTHIHFDHAGAAWALAQNGTKVYVHPRGLKHLHDPSRLYNSAARIYGDKMEFLWGKMEGIAMENLHATSHEEVFEIGGKKIIAHHTPGHAVHHIAWQIDDELIAGDVAGCKINGGPVVPPCPPPDIDIEAWENSLDLIAALNLKALHLTHYGRTTDVDVHLKELRNILHDWANWMKPHAEQHADMQALTPKFQAYVAQQMADAGLTNKQIQQYESANPAWMSVAGLMRYWSKKLGIRN